MRHTVDSSKWAASAALGIFTPRANRNIAHFGEPHPVFNHGSSDVDSISSNPLGAAWRAPGMTWSSTG